jgi:hypothetical protein
VVNRRLRPAEALILVRRLAREHDLRVRELPGRGKGSHRIFALEDAAGKEAARFGLTGHRADLSWTVLRRLEERLEPWFGERWTEQ